MTNKKKKLGLPTVFATGVGMIVATSCLLSLGQGASAIGVTFIFSMLIALGINICTALSISELNSLMPNLTGGLAQYTQASWGPFITIFTMVGGYIVCNIVVACAESAMFGITLSGVIDAPIPSWAYTIFAIIVLGFVNYMGVNVFAKIQDIVAYALIASLIIMGILGCIKANPETVVNQPAVLNSDFSSVISLCGMAFFLFIGCEFVIPIAKHVKNPSRNIPLGMVLSLVIVCGVQCIMIFGFSNYVPWSDLAESATPHVLYGSLLLGPVGKIWMTIVSCLAVTSTINSQISAVSYIILGMSKINLLPKVLGKTNKHGAPYWGIVIVALPLIVVNVAGVASSDSLSMLILVGCVFWMLSYLFTNLNVIIMRVREPNAKRSFKLPLGPVIPLIGALGTAWMIWNIDSDPDARTKIYIICLIIGAILAIYAAIWVKCVMKEKLFAPTPISKILENDSELYESYKESATRLGDKETKQKPKNF